MNNPLITAERKELKATWIKAKKDCVSFGDANGVNNEDYEALKLNCWDLETELRKPIENDECDGYDFDLLKDLFKERKKLNSDQVDYENWLYS